MSNGWITATGEVEASTSNLHNPDLPTSAPSEPRFVGGWVSGSTGEKTPDVGGKEYTLRPNDDESKGFMSTARTQAGSMIMGRAPRGTDVIKIHGMPVDLNNAASLGLVTRNPDGTFSDNVAPAVLKDPTAEAKATAPAEKAAAEAKTGPDGVSFGEAAEATLQELMAGQQPGNLYKTVDSILHTGDVDKATIERMASTAGVEPGVMAEKVATVWQGAYEAASEFMADAGIENGDAFQTFITSDLRRKADMMEAARNFFVHGKDEGLQTMADAYLPHMDRYEGARVQDLLTQAGWQSQNRPGGGIDVIVNGVPVSWEVAVKQKIITFSRG